MKKFKSKLKLGEGIFKWIFIAGDKYKMYFNRIKQSCRLILTVALFLFTLSFMFYIGFNYTDRISKGLTDSFRIFFLIIFVSKYLPEILSFRRNNAISTAFRILVFIFSLAVFLSNFNFVNIDKSFWNSFYGNKLIILSIFLIGISEISVVLRFISAVKIAPALIFSSGFLLIILIGSVLLLLPKAHNGQLSYLDSLFTSVSAVCVTGLIVVNTATAFTVLGKTIILGLIQIGGLGIMTFTGFFGYIFTSTGSSFRDRLLLKEIFSSESLTNLFKLLVKILLLTFLIETAGALIIYIRLDPETEDRVMFSVFHSVSAFCNAGFSTMSEGLATSSVRDNNGIHLSVAVLIILGGMGFPVLVNMYASVKHFILTAIRKAKGRRSLIRPLRRDYSTRIVIYTTIILIIIGSLLYYFSENKNSLEGSNISQNAIVSFFGSVSARTAGFNITDISLWNYPTVFLMILLMWIGASPGSTGGGIKTTTFAIAIRSAWSNLRGKEHLRIGNREVGNNTLNRVLSIIFLSILVIFTGFFCLLITEPGHNPVYLLFECVSAFSTVGLSLANSASLSQTGKIVIILLMFIGRIGPVTLLSGIMISRKKIYSRYPEMEIVIN